MNRRLLVSLVMSGVVFGSLSAVFAAGDPGIDPQLKSNPDPSAQKSVIAGAVNKEVAKLANDADPTGQSAARDWLVAETLLNNSADATSSGYIDIYTDSVNKSFAPLLANPATSTRTKVLAAIVTEKVAEHANNINLVPTVELLLADKSDAVAMWGERAASKLSASVLQAIAIPSGDRDKFINAIVKAVADHPTAPIGGAIAEDAYLGLNPISNKLQVSGPVLQSLINANLQMQSSRIALYKTDMPDNPNADTYGSLFLLDDNYWGILTEKQQLAAMQSASDLIWMAAQRAAAKASNQNQDLILAIEHESSLVSHLANSKLNDKNLADVAQQASLLKIGTRGDLIRQTCEPLYSAIAKSSNLFDELKQPPDLGGGPTTAPAN
jgi:hypothetical protein